MGHNLEHYRRRSEPLAYITLMNWPSTPLAEFGAGVAGQDNLLASGGTTVEREFDEFFEEIGSLQYSRRQELLHLEILNDEIAEFVVAKSWQEAWAYLQTAGGCWAEGTIAAAFDVLQDFKTLSDRIALRISGLRRLTLVELNVISEPMAASVVREILEIERKRSLPKSRGEFTWS
jgi:hypothetical protein